jgi:hypothetical protein
MVVSKFMSTAVMLTVEHSRHTGQGTAAAISPHTGSCMRTSGVAVLEAGREGACNKATL